MIQNRKHTSMDILKYVHTMLCTTLCGYAFVQHGPSAPRNCFSSDSWKDETLMIFCDIKCVGGHKKFYRILKTRNDLLGLIF